ncbi:MAG: 4Fe-4S dicluster domain-containing protein [Oscillospiraceae bacterium]|nr:4Fe-4S dicluster domain-containing protein [Oscillospiraceae bacterium]
MGVADLQPVRAYILREYGEFFARWPRAVAVALYFPREIAGQLLHGPTLEYNYYYHVLNRQLDAIAVALTNCLAVAGYSAYPIPSSAYRIPPDGHTEHPSGEGLGTELKGAFSHKLAAAQAGLGWIGKSCQLITPQAGPWLRLATVLTDAPLAPDHPIANRCGNCTKCRDACPAHAISGVPFQPEDMLEKRIDIDSCIAHLRETGASFGKEVCNQCGIACPWGRLERTVSAK